MRIKFAGGFHRAAAVSHRWRLIRLGRRQRRPITLLDGAKMEVADWLRTMGLEGYELGVEFSIIPIRIRSDRLRACSFSIMWARCNSTVRKLMPRLRAMTLLGSPLATSSNTSRSRGVSEAARTSNVARSRRSSYALSFQCSARSML